MITIVHLNILYQCMCNGGMKQVDQTLLDKQLIVEIEGMNGKAWVISSKGQTLLDQVSYLLKSYNNEYTEQGMLIHK